MLNLGSLEFTLGINTRGLDEAYRRVESFGTKVASVQNMANRGAETQIGAYRRIENAILSAGESLNSLLHKIETSKVAPQIKADLIKEAEKAYSDLTERATQFKKVTDGTNLDRTMAKFKNDLGDVSRTLGHITAEERAAADEARKLAAAQREVANAAAKAEGATVRQSNAIAGAAERARNLAQAVRNADLGSGGGAAKIALEDRIQAQFTALKNAMSGPEPLRPKEFSAAVNAYKAGIGEISRELRQLKGDAIAPAIENFNQFKNTLATAGSTMLLVNGHLGGMSTRLIALSTIVGRQGVMWGAIAAGMTSAGLAVTALVRGSLQAGMKIEKVTMALKAVTGSTAAAETQLDFLRATADTTGQVFTELATSYTRYLAASTAAGQSISTTQQQFHDISMAAGILQLSVEDTQGTFRAFEQMMSKGTVQAEELRGQLGDRLPGAFNIAAEAMGKTTAELGKMMKAGEVLSSELIPKFIETMKVMYNINGKPIDTLQASLNRAQNAVTDFFAAFANNTQIMSAAKAILEAVAKVINYLTVNMDDLIEGTIKVTGAIAAFTAAWFAWQALIVAGAGLQAAIAGMTALARLITVATAATRGLTLAQLALNAAMAANIAGKLIAFLVRLGLAIGAAVVSYKAMTDWLDNTAASMDANLDYIEEYIATSKRMGSQIRETTKDLLQQAKALTIVAQQQAIAAGSALREGLQDNAANRLRDFAKSGLNPFGYGDDGIYRSAEDARIARLKELTQGANDAAAAATRSAAALRSLGDVANLPELGAGGGGHTLGSGDDSDGSKAENRIEKVLDLVLAYKKLQEQLDVMSQGPDALERLDSLQEARDIVDGFNEEQLAKTDAALKAIGLSTGTVTERLAGLINGVEKGTDAIDAFKDVWEDINDAQTDAANTFEQLGLLLGGGSSMDLRGLDNLQKARDLISELDADGIQALLGKIQELTGAIIVSTNPAEALAQAIADIWAQSAGGEDAIAALTDLNGALEDMYEDIRENRTRVEGMNKGLSDEDLDRYVRATMMVEHYRDALKAAGVSAEESEAKIMELQKTLGALEQSEKILEWAEQWKDWKDGAARALAETVGAAARDFDNIADLARGLVDRLLDMFTEMFVVEPLFRLMQNIMNGGTGEGVANGENTLGGGILGSLGKLFDWADIMHPGGGIGGGISKLLSSTGTGALKGFSQGGGHGLINGIGTNSSDSMLARVSDGEFTMDANATTRWGAGNLAALNAGINPWARGSQSKAPIEVTVRVEGARGNAEIKHMAYQGTMEAMKQYDRNVGDRAQNNIERYS